MSSNISSSNMNFYTNIYLENKVFAINKVRNKKKWTKEEDLKLIKLAERNKEKHWKEIARNFLNKNPLQCFSRYKRIKPGIIKGTWTKEEDDRILSLVSIYGKSWSKLAKIMKSRNGKQIRDRFINVLDPEVKKGKFTYKEDRKIKELYVKYGPRWATIARDLPNRTPDMIKNRFHSSIKKYLHQRNFLSRIENRTGIPIRESECNSKENEAPLNNTNFMSDLKISNSKSLTEKNFLNNFSNCSSSIQEVNSEHKIFQNRLNQMFYYDNRNNSNSIPNDKIKENDIYVNENENNSNTFEKIISFENFTYNDKKEFKSLGIKKSNLSSKLEEADLFNDSERTESNSEYSFSSKDKNNQFSKFGNKKNNISKDEINEKFDFPQEQIHSANYTCDGSKNDSKSTQNNFKNQSYFNNQNNNSLKNNFLLNNLECRGVINQNNLNDSTFFTKNLKDFLEKENKIYNKDKENNHNKISIAYGNETAQNPKSNKNKLLNGDFIKNEQEFEKLKSNKDSAIKILTEEKIMSDFFIIESHLNNNTQNFNDFESHANKNYFLNCNENSKSTNLVTYQNISSYSSNSHTLDENDNSSNDNIKNKYGNSYIITGLEENYQMNFMNFADSPFRMNSPKYYDFEDFFNSN